MPRPKKSPNEKRDKRIPVAFSNTEIVKIREITKKERIPVSTWIRNKILDLLNGKQGQ